MFHFKILVGHVYFYNKETTLERTDFTFQLSLFVTVEKEIVIFITFFFPFFVSCCPREFKLRWAEHIQTMKAKTNSPRMQLFLMQSLQSTFMQKETRLERADISLQQFIFVAANATRNVFDIPFLVSCCPHKLKQGQFGYIRTRKIQTIGPGEQLFLMQSLH